MIPEEIMTLQDQLLNENKEILYYKFNCVKRELASSSNLIEFI